MINLILPISIGSTFYQLRCVTITIKIMRWLDVGIFASLPVNLSPLFCIKHVVLLGYRLQAGCIVDIDSQLVAFALLGCDDDDTIGSTATIDRCRRGILQNLDRLDVCRIDGIHVFVGSDTINNQERATAVDSTHTTHTDRRATTTWSCISHNLHTSQLTLHGVEHVRIRCADRLFHIHHRNSTSQIGLTLSGITCNDNLAQFFCIVIQHNFHIGDSFYFFCLATNIRNNECRTWCYL